MKGIRKLLATATVVSALLIPAAAQAQWWGGTPWGGSPIGGGPWGAPGFGAVPGLGYPGWGGVPGLGGHASQGTGTPDAPGR